MTLPYRRIYVKKYAASVLGSIIVTVKIQRATGRGAAHTGHRLLN
jgi:hypothetical protein